MMAEYSTKQKKELRKLCESKPLCIEGMGKAECFVLCFIFFEAQSRKIWHYYRCRKVYKQESKAGIPIVELKKAMAHFGMQFDDDKLNILLDSRLVARGKKSARNLRNGMVHQWLAADCKEAGKRLDEFRSCFQEFDTVVGRDL